MPRRSTSTTMILATLVGLGLIACGGESSESGAPSTASPVAQAPAGAQAPAVDQAPPADQQPPAGQLPPGHPPIDAAPPIGTVAAHASAITAGGGPGGEPTWTVPAGWKEETPTSQMRRAQYRVPAAAGDTDDGECVIFYFGAGQGGDIRSNVDRWASQFTGWTEQTKPQSTQVKVGAVTVTRVEARGTYTPSPMMMGGGATPPPKPGYMLLGAIVPGADANWFLKCTGPEKTMGANRASVNSMIGSIHYGK